MKKYLYAKLSWMKSSLVEDVHFVTARRSWREARQTRVEKSRSWKKKFACMEDDPYFFGHRQRGHMPQLSKKMRHRPENEISIDDAHLDILYATIQIFEVRFISKREIFQKNIFHPSKKLKFITPLLSSLSIDRWTKLETSFGFWYALKKKGKDLCNHRPLKATSR